jgi:hypothetical protein
MYQKETFMLVVCCVYKFFFQRKNILAFSKNILDAKLIDFQHSLGGFF